MGKKFFKGMLVSMRRENTDWLIVGEDTSWFLAPFGKDFDDT